VLSIAGAGDANLRSIMEGGRGLKPRAMVSWWVGGSSMRTAERRNVLPSKALSRLHNRRKRKAMTNARSAKPIMPPPIPPTMAPVRVSVTGVTDGEALVVG